MARNSDKATQSAAAIVPVDDASLNDDPIFQIIEGGIFGDPMVFLTVDIDDEMAIQMLTYNVEPAPGKEGTNRVQSEPRIQHYHEEMLAGRWRLSPQPICFAINDAGDVELIDGAHRLKALRRTAQKQPGFTAQFAVALRVPHPASAVLDRGKARTFANDLQRQGKVNAAALSSALRMLHGYDNVPYTGLSTWSRTTLSALQIPHLLETYPTVEQGIKETRSAAQIVRAPVAAAMFALIGREFDVFLAKKFLDALATGADMSIDNPVYRLREFILVERSKAVKYRWSEVELLGMVISAFNAWVIGDDSWTAGSVRRTLNLNVPGKTPMFPRLRTKEQVETPFEW